MSSFRTSSRGVYHLVYLEVHHLLLTVLSSAPLLVAPAHSTPKTDSILQTVSTDSPPPPWSVRPHTGVDQCPRCRCPLRLRRDGASGFRKLAQKPRQTIPIVPSLRSKLRRRRVAFGAVQLKPYMTRPLRFRASTTSVAVRVFARRYSQ